jgi:hypothetical protein
LWRKEETMAKTLEIFRTCEEASPLSRAYKIDCGAPANAIIWHNKDQRAYVMCPPCASHNVANRGGIELVPRKEWAS